jgi:hypothetical protein
LNTIKEEHIRILTSVVGLPPVFLFEIPDQLILTSDLSLLLSVPGIKLNFDPEGIADLLIIGHPINQRTLFRGIRVLSGGESIEIRADGQISASRIWNLPSLEPFREWDLYLDTQIEAFKHTTRKFDLSNSSLALTGGLDTRTILAALIQQNRAVPAYTTTGKVTSLDARIARGICESYGIEHTTVSLDEDFFQDLPGYWLEASRLSGGLSSVDLAIQVYTCKNLKGLYSANLTGSFGNQIVRRGVERIRMRKTDSRILDGYFRRKVIDRSTIHWFLDVGARSGRLDYEFLVRNEATWAGIGGYCLGSSFAIQQMPYTNHHLIGICSRRPRSKIDHSAFSFFQLRFEDICHRFLGEPESRSFQRKLVKRVGGPLASLPINWGWRPSGGISFQGIALGGLAFIDAFVSSRLPNHQGIRRAMVKLNVSGLHNFKQYNTCLNFMRDFVYEMLLSKSARETGIFNLKGIEGILNEHYLSGRDHSQTLSTALAILAAKEIFRASLS